MIRFLIHVYTNVISSLCFLPRWRLPSIHDHFSYIGNDADYRTLNQVKVTIVADYMYIHTA